MKYPPFVGPTYKIYNEQPNDENQKEIGTCIYKNKKWHLPVSKQKLFLHNFIKHLSKIDLVIFFFLFRMRPTQFLEKGNSKVKIVEAIKKITLKR